MATNPRPPLARRPSLGNSSKLTTPASAANNLHVKSRPQSRQSSGRRSSFISKGSGIEAVIPLEHSSFLDTDPCPTPAPYSNSKGQRYLSQKRSLNALDIGKRRSLTPGPNISIPSFVDQYERDSISTLSSRLSNAMTDTQDISIDMGDTVAVPGGMTGTVKFLGMVRGKKGIFAGVELDGEFASRGKNDGDVEGTKYFSTSVPGSGIFLPAYRATKHASPASTTGNFPPTPTTPSFTASLNLNKGARESSLSPQTPSIPKFSRSVTGTSRPNFSQSVGSGARAPSPQLRKPASRPSLPRPDSPQRKPTGPNKFSQSLRGGRPPGVTPDAKTTLSASKTPGTTRSPSRTQSRNQERSPDATDTTPTANISRLGNGNSTAARPRGQSQTRNPLPNGGASQDSDRLKRELQARDKQLKEQAASLAEMESSLAELQTMVASSTKANRSSTTSSMNSDELPSDVSQLRSLIREKNERIASLTAEFDAHRADFRSTIDTLEMASTETERVYEKRVEELLRENEELGQNSGGVEQVAQQLKSLEDLVAELEEGLEDARRGEAEARSEVEFLRGEVERGRSELRREREKAAKALKGAGAAVDGAIPDQRDDEIRGLKAIIHSLSSNPEGSASPAPNGAANGADAATLANLRRDMDALKRERSELQGLVERKNFREEELEREVAALKLTGGAGSAEDDTPRRGHADSVASAKTAIRPGSGRRDGPPPSLPDFPPPPSALNVPKSPMERPGTSHSGASAFEDASESMSPRKEQAMGLDRHASVQAPAPLSVSRSTSSNKVQQQQQQQQERDDGTGMAALTGDGPAPGKASGRVDMSRWCALCERDGHESVDCPFEEF